MSERGTALIAARGKSDPVSKRPLTRPKKNNLLIFGDAHWTPMNIQRREAFFSVGEDVVVPAIWPDFSLRSSQSVHG
jgi:hypothetical protein